MTSAEYIRRTFRPCPCGGMLAAMYGGHYRYDYNPPATNYRCVRCGLEVKA